VKDGKQLVGQILSEASFLSLSPLKIALTQSTVAGLIRTASVVRIAHVPPFSE
jgi:hypothetical protein